MKRLRVVALCLVAALVFLAAGFWFGAHEGSYLAELIVAPARGVFAARALTDMKNGKPEAATIVFESEVDRGLLSVNELAESPVRRYVAALLNMGAGSYDLDVYAVRLATYRKAKPSPIVGEYLTHDPEETPEQRALVDELAERHREVTRIIQRMVERYAPK